MDRARRITWNDSKHGSPRHEPSNTRSNYDINHKQVQPEKPKILDKNVNVNKLLEEVFGIDNKYSQESSKKTQNDTKNTENMDNTGDIDMDPLIDLLINTTMPIAEKYIPQENKDKLKNIFKQNKIQKEMKPTNPNSNNHKLVDPIVPVNSTITKDNKKEEKKFRHKVYGIGYKYDTNSDTIDVKVTENTTMVSAFNHNESPLKGEGNIIIIGDNVLIQLKPGTKFEMMNIPGYQFTLGWLDSYENKETKEDEKSEEPETKLTVFVQEGTNYRIKNDETGILHKTCVKQEFYLEKGAEVIIGPGVTYFIGKDESVFTKETIIRLV